MARSESEAWEREGGWSLGGVEVSLAIKVLQGA